MIDRLLLEKIPLAGIARVLKVSESWLQGYVNQCYREVPRQVQVIPKFKRVFRVQMDELGPFVDDKGNKQWVWLALDVKCKLSGFGLVSMDVKGNCGWRFSTVGGQV